METTRKKALEIMQKGIVIYKLVSLGWDVSDHFGDGYDLIAFKDKNTIKIELKAIDLNGIKDGNKATQHLTANEIISSTHIILTIFNDLAVISTYVMGIPQFVEKSLPRKYLNEYKNYQEFLPEYLTYGISTSLSYPLHIVVNTFPFTYELFIGHRINLHCMLEQSVEEQATSPLTGCLLNRKVNSLR